MTPDTHAPSGEELAKAMLDISSFADHFDCEVSYGISTRCTCGYATAKQRVLDLAEQVARTPQPEEWKPIASAPKDGTTILLYCPDDAPALVAGNFCSGNDWSGWQYADELLSDAAPGGPSPTHWMPLPQPPSSEPNR